MDEEEVIRKYFVSKVEGKRFYEGNENRYNKFNLMASFRSHDTLLEALILAQDEGEFGTYQIPAEHGVKGPRVHIEKIIYKEAGKESTREVTWSYFERFGRPLTFSEGTRIILDNFAKQSEDN